MMAASFITRPFRSVLIANRGEIACRVIRSVKAAGMRAIAVYSDADADAPHVKIADEAFRLGPPPVAESYLSVDRIMAAIDATGAEAVHPGYGFLSENAAFAEICAEHDIVFIGPPANAIALMGDKAKAKRRMIDAGVPCIPGYQGDDQIDATLISEAARIGFPLMVKAAAGGGGRGMRLVRDAGAIVDAITMARSEAENAFGSGDLILERAIMEPRHVEIQVFADCHGETIHLGERDCSVQRRHQKVLEEAPCPVMTPELRARMGAAAVKAARDIGYVGAGTVEFLLDGTGEFYFLEMNTRLQVEHPVTELVTGLDLVALQLRVAAGAPLGLTQEEVALRGHAIEARLYAEDPAQDFLPAAGDIHYWRGARNDGVRIDAGVETGGVISPYYDPMIAKVIAYGATRNDARLRLAEALKKTVALGVTTNRTFLIDALERPAFAAGEATTAFIAENFDDQALAAAPLAITDAAIGAVLLFTRRRQQSLDASLAVTDDLLNWSSAHTIGTPFSMSDGNDAIDLTLTPTARNSYDVTSASGSRKVAVLAIDENDALVSVDGSRVQIIYHYRDNSADGHQLIISIDGCDRLIQDLNTVVQTSGKAGGAGAVCAPMHGQLLELFVSEGDAVTAGDKLAVLEAMKMQHELRAEIDGVVSEIAINVGAQTPADALIMTISPNS